MKTGDMAPDISFVARDGSPVRIADFRGRSHVVLFFYPRDASLICTKQACAFRDNYGAFAPLGALVFGVSPDDAASHGRFAERRRLPYPLLSDPGTAGARALGLRPFLGFLPPRSTVVIDKGGMLRLLYTAHLRAGSHVEQALRVLRDLPRVAD